MGEDPGCSALGRDWFRFNGNIQEKGEKRVIFADIGKKSLYLYSVTRDNCR